MERAFDKASVIKTLRDGIKKGYWTLEDLDTPSRFSWVSRDISGVTPAGNISMIKPYMLKPHKNLLREASPEVAVEVIDPKDFIPELKNEPGSETSHSNEPY
tara:strand:- start:35 stop:340 length:306 start_codon:yes stop_codon:yes gene_type:complete